MRSRIAATLVAALAISACTGGTAFAKATKAKANIQKENHSCGANEPARPVIGTVTFKRVGNIVTFKVVVKHGEPNTEYFTTFTGNFCEYLGGAVAFTTNSKGMGKGSASVEVPAEDNEFFVDAIGAGIDNCTPYTLLP